LNLLVVLAVRCLLVALFLPFSALDKILNFRQALGQAEEAISGRWLAAVLIGAGFCIEVVMSAGVLTGIADRLAAFILAAYCLMTALLWKRFWADPDFRLRGGGTDRTLYWDFLKNLALAGGFLMLAFGSDAAGVRRFLSHPMASSHPYAIHEVKP
jgi:putative oxidoreductase